MPVTIDPHHELRPHLVLSPAGTVPVEELSARVSYGRRPNPPATPSPILQLWQTGSMPPSSVPARDRSRARAPTANRPGHVRPTAGGRAQVAYSRSRIVRRGCTGGAARPRGSRCKAGGASRLPRQPFSKLSRRDAGRPGYVRRSALS